MISFVNAKINIGLQIVGRRKDGYHDLQTVFYPVGLYAATPANPVSFCDLLEMCESEGSGLADGNNFRIILSGRHIDCPLEKNLVYKAAKLYFDTQVKDSFGADIYLEKYLPDGAGMGGGSADAAFVLKMLRDLHAEYLCRSFNNDVRKETVSDEGLAELALKLGADCPFFIYNKPAFASGIGERLQPIDLDLSGFWLLVVKPNVSISTREAFAGITPQPAAADLRCLRRDNIHTWKDFVKNDFEDSFFAKYPQIASIKEKLYQRNALYASMTGSGSCFYAIFDTFDKAQTASEDFEKNPTIDASYLLKL